MRKTSSRRELRIEELWPHKEFLVLKFAGIGSISDAEALIGCELQVPRSERVQLESGWNYVSDLIGCVVSDAGREIGKIEDVQFGTGEAPLLIVVAEKQAIRDSLRGSVFAKRRPCAEADTNATARRNARTERAADRRRETAAGGSIQRKTEEKTSVTLW